MLNLSLVIKASESDAELDIGEEGTAYCIISGELYEGPGWDDFMYTEEWVKYKTII